MRVAAVIEPDGGVLPCVLRDLSPTGARLSISRRYRLPESFLLRVRGCEHPFLVRRAWQRGDLAGVRLDAPGTMGAEA